MITEYKNLYIEMVNHGYVAEWCRATSNGKRKEKSIVNF